MYQNQREHRRDALVTPIAFGGLLIIVGFIFAFTPNLWQNVNSFFNDITSRAVPFGSASSQIFLPAPEHPAAHKVVYTALLQFDLAFGVLQLIVLGLRIGLRSKINRIAETLGNAVFWFGAAVLVNAFLLAGTLSSWFQYWAALVVVVGISFIARAIVHFAKR